MIIGLTGGIGSGKTAVSDSFEALGIDIVDADLASRVVVQKGKPCLAQIQEHFGDDILNEDEELDRGKLREIIFQSDQEKEWLESLLHPAIANQIKDELEASNSPYTILVSPLLLETNQKDYCSQVLVIDVPIEIQIERTLKRDGVSKEQVQSIISAQISRSERLNLADEVIVNDGSLEDLQMAVKNIHQKFLSQK